MLPCSLTDCKVANLSEKLETARQEKSALEAITTKIEDLMWEQGAEHQSEMTQMQAAYDQMILIKVKEVRINDICVYDCSEVFVYGGSRRWD